ncbi:MAG: hypothetical protein K1X64_01070 [Myxococcaceae bacterium]|nr:hypothetical protein [Myxococcaceae bacterium]
MNVSYSLRVSGAALVFAFIAACGFTPVSDGDGGTGGGSSGTGGNTATGGGTMATGGDTGTGGGMMATGGGIGTGGGTATGGGTGTGGGTATGGSIGTGGGTPFTFDAGTPPIIPITFALDGGCPNTVAPCGGALSGLYYYTEACAVPPSQIQQFCSTAQSSWVGTRQGALYFTPDTVGRNVHIQATGHITVPSNCAFLGCDTIQTALSFVFPGSTCGSSASIDGGCDCVASIDAGAIDSAPYTAQGTTFTSSPGSNAERSYPYCVNGNTLTYEDNASNSFDPGAFTLTKQ